MEYAWKSSIWIGIIISKSYKKAKDTIFDWQNTEQGQLYCWSYYVLVYNYFTDRYM